MSAWAFECQSQVNPAVRWFVSRTAVNELPTGTVHVLVRVNDDWLPAVVDRSREHAVDRMLLRDVIVDSETDGAEPNGSGAVESGPSTSREREIQADEPESPGTTSSARQVTAAAITMAGVKFVVVLVGLSTVSGPGESDLVIADLEPQFGVPVILMGQEEDGTPVYYGDPTLQELLAAVPVDRLPWKQYAV